MDKAWHERREAAVRAAVWEWSGIKLGSYAEIYGMSRQAVHYLSKKHNLTTDHWSFPQLLHEVLVERGNDSNLRRRLSDPSQCERLQTQTLEKLDNEHAKHIDSVRRKWGLAPLFKGKERTLEPVTNSSIKFSNPTNQSIKPALK